MNVKKIHARIRAHRLVDINIEFTQSNPNPIPIQSNPNQSFWQKRTPADRVEEALDRIKSAIAQQSGQIQSDHQWIESVRTIMRHYEKKISAVEEDANRVKANIQRLFEKKKRYEDMLLKLHMDEEKHAANPVPGQVGKPGEVYSPVVTTCGQASTKCD